MRAELGERSSLVQGMLLGERWPGCAHYVLDAGVTDVEDEAVVVQERTHVGRQLLDDARPQLLGARDQQAVIGSHPQKQVERMRHVAQVRLDVFVP